MLKNNTSSQNKTLAGIIDKLQKVSGPDKKGWYTALCPFHNDQHHPNLRFRETGFRCMTCGKKGPLKEMAEHLGIVFQDLLPGLTLRELANSKHIPESFLNSLGVIDGFSGSWKQRRPCVDIPYMDEAGQIKAIQKRLSLNGVPRFIWRRGDHTIPYGLWRLKEERVKGYLIIVEGTSDCWTLWFHGIPAIGLPGADTWKKEYQCFFQGLVPYLWVEPDEGGKTLLKAVSATLPEVRLIQALSDNKDPSALFLNDKDNFPQVINKLIEMAKPASESSFQSRSQELSRLSLRIQSLAKAPNIIDQLCETISTSGYAGDIRPALCAYIALTSRILDKPLNIIFIAQSGSGKNASIEYILPFFPQDAYYIVRAASPLALVYSDQDFRHKTVILWEADSLPEEGPAASALRALMSDQRLEYQVVEKDESGHQKVRQVVKEGPTGIITTSTLPLREQASTRMLTINISDSPDQTRAVLQAIAKKETGAITLPEFSQWIDFQCWLAMAGEHRVIVPFAQALAERIPAEAIRVRRDFPQILTVIKSFALIHLAQRGRDQAGRIVADLKDYELACWLLEEVFATTVTGGLSPAIKETVQAVNDLYRPGNPVSIQQLSEHLKLAKSTVSYRVTRAVNGGWLVNKTSKPGISAQLEPGVSIPNNTFLPKLDDMLCVITSGNPSNTRTPPPLLTELASENGSDVFEYPFEHPFKQFEQTEEFDQSFEHLAEAQNEAKKALPEGTVRVFEPKTEVLTHIQHTDSSKSKETPWQVEL